MWTVPLLLVLALLSCDETCVLPCNPLTLPSVQYLYHMFSLVCLLTYSRPLLWSAFVLFIHRSVRSALCSFLFLVLHSGRLSLFVLHFVYPSFCLSFVRFVLHSVRPLLCLSLVMFILHSVHPSLCPSFTQFVVSSVHSSFCLSFVRFVLERARPSICLFFISFLLHTVGPSHYFCVPHNLRKPAFHQHVYLT